MARYKILLLRKDGSEVAELAVDALWRSDAVAFAERVTEDAAVKGCAYELWRDARKIVHDPSVRQWQFPFFEKTLRRLCARSKSIVRRAKRRAAHN